MLGRFLLACAALSLAAPGVATRDLPVPADKGWQHADSGLILPAAMDGLRRKQLIDNTTSERDVIASFQSPDAAVEATVFLFHPALDDTAIWFDRVQATIMARDLFGGVTAAGIAPTRFAPPRSATSSGLRQTYTPTRRTYRGTALAVMPLGEWLVVVRLSATALDATATDARMSRVIAAMRWPMGVADAPAASPIGSCSDALRFGPAKPSQTQQADALSSLIMGAVLQDAKAKSASRPVHWCRDAASGSAFGIYRSEGAGYQIALHDAGRVIHVTPSLDTQLGKGNSYSVSLTDVDDSVHTYPSFEGLPNPDQILALLGKPSVTRANE